MILSMIKVIGIFCTLIGVALAGWGVLDLTTDNGGQQATGIKKVIGGILTAIIFYMVFAYMYSETEKALSLAGMTAYILPTIQQLIHWH